MDRKAVWAIAILGVLAAFALTLLMSFSLDQMADTQTPKFAADVSEELTRSLAASPPANVRLTMRREGKSPTAPRAYKLVLRPNGAVAADPRALSRVMYRAAEFCAAQIGELKCEATIQCVAELPSGAETKTDFVKVRSDDPANVELIREVGAAPAARVGERGEAEGHEALTRPAAYVVDLHADLLWRTETTGKDPWEDCPGEMLDLPRMLAGGPSLQLFTIYTPGELRGEAATAYARKLHAIWTEVVARGAGRIGWARTRDDVLRAPADGLTGLLSMEGASPLRGEIALLDDFFAMGVRSLGLTHNPRNEAGDGCMVPVAERRGLTDFGRALVRRCAELGVLLDVAHLAPEGFRDLMDEAAKCASPPPVVSTHTGASALTKHARNLADAQLRELADSGGLAGVTCYPPHLRREGRADSIENALDHLDHIAEVCGVEHVAVGADLDGFDPPGLPGGADVPSVYGMIESGLLARGWRRDEVDLALGGNARRVLASVLR